ncbi:hypothetical protein BFP77_00940 [Maribacter sp. 4U21]|nr:hypothetical protein BFP77_00940 [Maribacter sp. 4U21]
MSINYKLMKYFKPFIKKNFYTIRIFLIATNTLLFLYLLYFYDKKISFDNVMQYLTDYRMYLASIFSVLGAFLVSNTLFNKKNIENITSS